MSYLDKLLASKEEIVRLARDHWTTLLPTLLVDAALSVVIVGLAIGGVLLATPWTWLGLILLILPLGHLGVRLMKWWNHRYIVTNRRIIQISGTFNTRVSDTSLEKVNDIVMEQSTLGRMLRFGRLEIISGSDSGIDIFPRIANPIGFKKDVLDQKDALAGVDVGDERSRRSLRDQDVPDLIAELDDLHQAGVLTEAEFEEKKQQLLDQLGDAE